jgi:hypothetical protein
MIRRRTTLVEALKEIESGILEGVTAIVVNSDWWQVQSRQQQTEFRERCEAHGIQLRVDSEISRHFVELASYPSEPPLSTERRV